MMISKYDFYQDNVKTDFSYLQSFDADPRRDKTAKIAGFGYPVGEHDTDVTMEMVLKEVDLKLTHDCASVYGAVVRGNNDGENVKIKE